MSEDQDPTTDRLGLEVLRPDECWRRLADCAVGRIAFVDAGEPLVFPVTHAVHDHSIVFRSQRGSKLEAALMAHTVAFEADEWSRVERRGWSVLARGTATTVYEDDQIEALDSLAVQPWVDAVADGTWVRIRVDEISGRQIR
jgi:uncharacterized protein